MKLAIFVPLPAAVRALSFSAYDLGFHGIYPTQNYLTLGQPSPWVQISQWDSRCESDGAVVLLSPRGVYVPNPGPVIVDSRGELIWLEGKYGEAMNLRVQRYEGQDYLTFWSGTSHGAHSNGSYYMLDSTYELIHKVSAVGADLAGDLHEFEVTDDGTALITLYQDVEIDCTSVGFEGKCWINDCLFQEIDIKTGNLIFQWRASDNVPLTDSYKGRGGDGKTQDTSYDFFHLNSIEKDSTGNYLISSRHMHAIYYIDRTGNILWKLGGRHSDFEDLSGGYASNFRWQHHARWHENHTMSLFDNNGNNVFHSRAEHSRGMEISLDLEKMTVELQNTYIHPDKILAISQGSMQVIPETGHVLVGWGNTPAYTEFTAGGEVLCSMYFGALLFSEILDLGWVKSYRAFKSPWVGKPKAPPDIAVKGGEVYVSWNGATEVAKWRLQSAESPDADDGEFMVVEELLKNGFETAFMFDGVEDHFVRAIALDATGNVLGVTKIIDTFSPPAVPTWSIFLFLASFTLVGLLVWRNLKTLWYQVSRLLSALNSRRTQDTAPAYELLESQPEQDDPEESLKPAKQMKVS
ncbi:hypothetical protein BDZ45DRAFT_167713 [Acephala macrosclerotiorum]|nr:hypothetical protein BDZ45DRAFT_167713 [Acephala macrosclerotiorum]